MADQGERGWDICFAVFFDMANVDSPALNPKGDPMKKTAPKKMALSRETLGILSDSDTKEAMGGVTNQCTTSVKVCCPDM